MLKLCGFTLKNVISDFCNFGFGQTAPFVGGYFGPKLLLATKHTQVT